MAYYIVESYDSTISHHGKPLTGTLAVYKSKLYLCKLALAAAPDVVDSWSGRGMRRAPYAECPWWVSVGEPQAHWPGDPTLRSSATPLGSEDP